ncbi:MAG: DUF3566 domain-containing protein [archaeon]
MAVLKRVGILSAAKICGVLTAILSFIYAILLAVIFAIGAIAAPSAPAAAMMFGFSLFGLILFPAIGLIIGFVFGAIYAFLYNLVAGWIGGLEIELTK